jgi:hypothetical protein
MSSFPQDPGGSTLTATPDETLSKRLQMAETDVAREFDSLDREVVRKEFEQVTADLLKDATVTDFVPVLAGRHVREILIAHTQTVTA